MALFQEWKAAVTRDPALLAGAIEEGIRALGISSIKPDQLTAVKSLLYGEDVFVSAPTGFGKSLVYQLLPFCSASLLRSCLCTNKSPVVVVVSPLVSLMYDQVTKLVKKGVKAACVSGDSASVKAVFADVIGGQITHLFGRPEAFITNSTDCARVHSLFALTNTSSPFNKLLTAVNWSGLMRLTPSPRIPSSMVTGKESKRWPLLLDVHAQPSYEFY